jgi:ribosomal protein L29
MKNSIKELHSKTAKQLEKDVQSLRSEIAKTTLEISVQPVKDTNVIKKKRHQLAQVLTALNQKKHEVNSKKK